MTFAGKGEGFDFYQKFLVTYIHETTFYSAGFLCLVFLFHFIYVMLTRVIWQYHSQHYLIEFSGGNTRIVCEICSELTIKTTERRQ